MLSFCAQIWDLGCALREGTTRTLGRANEGGSEADSCICVLRRVGGLYGHDVAKRGSLQKSPSPLPPARVRPDQLDLYCGSPRDSGWARGGLWWRAGL